MGSRIRLRGAVLAMVAFLLTACALKPPVSVAVRESLLGQGLVISVTNTSDQYLHEVAVAITSPDGETRQFYTPTLDPHESVSVGWLKLAGWPIPEGSEVTVSCQGYPLAAGPWKLFS